MAYRYFATPARKFIIGDAPGHEQYTRNMVTAASGADAAVVLVDATKLKWQSPGLELLPQTRRHTLLAKLLRVPAIVFAVNKLDAVEDATLAFANIRAALEQFTEAAGIHAGPPCRFRPSRATTWSKASRAGAATGLSLLALLEQMDVTPAETTEAFAFPVQWVEKFSSSSDTSQGRRVFWGRVATGSVQPGREVTVLPSGQTARVAQVLDHVRQPATVAARHSAGIILDREVDVSGRLAAGPRRHHPSREVSATVAWLDDDGRPGRAVLALHGHRWVKAKVKKIVHKLDVNSLAEGRRPPGAQHRARGAGAAGAAGHPAL